VPGRLKSKKELACRIREMAVQLGAALSAELLSFDDPFSALWTGLLYLDQLLAALSAEGEPCR
jgi:hypothetical protein